MSADAWIDVSLCFGLVWLVFRCVYAFGARERGSESHKWAEFDSAQIVKAHARRKDV